MTPDQEQWNARVQAATSAKLMARTKERGGDLDFEPREPKKGSLRPFKHAAKLYTEIMEARAAHTGPLIDLQIKLSEFPPYISRGHGWRGRIKNRTILGCWNQDRSKPYPNLGRSEAARRAFQSLPPPQRRLAREIEKGVML